MKKLQDDVKEFMQGVGQEVPHTVVKPDKELALLRYKLVQEEANELREALGIDAISGSHEDFYDFNEENVNLVEIADAIADLCYVAVGLGISLGIDLEPIWNEVQKSNMTKLIDGYKREDGKWMKGKSYQPPRIKEIMDDQIGKEKTTEEV